MKSLAVTIFVNLVLSSSSTVMGMPHALNTGFQHSLTVRSMGQQVRHSLLSSRLIETAPKSLLIKRGNYQEDDQDDHDNYNDIDVDSDDDEDACEDSSDSSYAKHPANTPNLHTPYRIGLNSSTTQPHKSTSPIPIIKESTETYSKPARLPRASDHDSTKNKHQSIESQKHDAPSDKYTSNNGKKLEHHGFVGSYDGYQGKATFFSQGGSAGACGKVHEDSDYVVAIQSQMYGGGKFCGKTVLVTRKSTGKSIKCVAADECPGCPTDQSLDLSIAAFNALGNPDEGIFDIHWQVMD